MELKFCFVLYVLNWSVFLKVNSNPGIFGKLILKYEVINRMLKLIKSIMDIINVQAE